MKAYPFNHVKQDKTLLISALTVMEVYKVDADDPALNTYDMVKRRFEVNCMQFGNQYIIQLSMKVSIVSKRDIRWRYNNLRFWVGTECKPFISKWMKDPYIRVVGRFTVDPYNTMPSVCNVCPIGKYKAETLPPVCNDRVPELIAPITQHFLDVIANGDYEQSMNLQYYLAHIIRRPWIKSQIAILLHGETRIGKSILFDFFGEEVLGSPSHFKSYHRAADILQGNQCARRVLVTIENLQSFNRNKKFIYKMITDPTVIYHRKFKGKFRMENMTNVIITSHVPKAPKIDPKDPNFKIFHCSSIYKRNTEYFYSLFKHLARPEVARAYYQFLMSIQLDDNPRFF
jgi:hypothetical protein